jgi:hypothetical protein
MIIIGLLATACTVVSVAVINSAANPIIAMNSPANNVQFREGDQVSVQATLTDQVGIVRVELSVDNNIVRADQLPNS